MKKMTITGFFSMKTTHHGRHLWSFVGQGTVWGMSLSANCAKALGSSGRWVMTQRQVAKRPAEYTVSTEGKKVLGGS
jgi:hypothetical protein